jgi:hypothetical protein
VPDDGKDFRFPSPTRHLHQAGFNYAMGDLLRIVEAQGDNLPR